MESGEPNKAERSEATALIFFCHGARDPNWRVPFDKILRQFRQTYPDQRVELAFLELMQPHLPDVIDRLASEGFSVIRVLPLFLAAGGHTRRDLPQLLAAARIRWPEIQFTASSALAEAQPMRDAIVRWASVGGPDTMDQQADHAGDGIQLTLIQRK